MIGGGVDRGWRAAGRPNPLVGQDADSIYFG